MKNYNGGLSMNRNQAKQLLPIIKAFSEGQDIEYFDKGDCKWRTCIELDFCYNVNYRIKHEPIWIPFTYPNTCLKEIRKHHPIGWVKEIKSGKLTAIVSVSQAGISFLGSNSCVKDLSCVFKEYTFADETPFGIKVEE